MLNKSLLLSSGIPDECRGVKGTDCVKFINNMADATLTVCEFYWNGVRVGFTTGANAPTTLIVGGFKYSQGELLDMEIQYPQIISYNTICRSMA